MEGILKSRRLRYAVVIIVVLLIGLWGTPRIIKRIGNEYPKPTDAPVDETAETEDEPPLVTPFYPTFEKVRTLTDRAALEEYLYTIDETAYVYDEDLDINAFLEMDFKAPLAAGSRDEPRILIFHTHSQETFSDSRPNTTEDTIVGVGSLLARILADEYGVSVVHDKGQYDVVDGAERREGSYERMEPSVHALLDKYPTVEVTVDLHRDGVPDHVRLLSMINGEPTARVMFFNGVSRLSHKGEPVEVESLANPFIKENLGLSLQLQLTANTLYPGFARKIYIKPYRYSLHFTPKSMLVEVGAQTSTLAEARNAMRPLAEILMNVLGEGGNGTTTLSSETLH